MGFSAGSAAAIKTVFPSVAAGMSDLQQQLDSVTQDLEVEEKRLAQVRADMEEAKARGDKQRVMQLEKIEITLSLEITQLRVAMNGLNDQLRGAHLVTAWQAINMPCPPIASREAGSPRGSISKTVGAHPHTFAGLQQLECVEAGLTGLQARLDNREHKYTPVRVHGGKFKAAADECEVRAPLSAIAPLIDSVAEGLGVKAQLSGGGSGRGSSCTDWYVLTTTNNSSSGNVSAQAGDATAAASSSAAAAKQRHPSSRVLACILVKGSWQVKLEPREELWLADQQRLDSLRPALQQLYGDMVAEEVQWGLLTTYNASLFVKRHECVGNKTLFVSPVYGHQQLLLVLLYLTEQAALAAPLKQQLQRGNVPNTPPHGCKYSVTLSVPEHRAANGRLQQADELVTLSVPEQLSASGRQQPAKEQRLGVWLTPAKRQRQHSPDLEAVSASKDSFTLSGELTPQHTYTLEDSGSSDSIHSSMLQSMFLHLLQLHVTPNQLTPAVKAAPSSECLEVEMLTLDYSQVSLKGYLAAGSHGKVLRGAFQNRQVVLKIFDRRYSGWEAAFVKELSAYALASALQDDVLCKVEHFGMFGHTGALFLALSPAGKAIDNTTAASASVQDGMRTALGKLHNAGILHGDVRLSNFCTADDGSVRVIDLDRACGSGVVEDAEAAKLEEQEELEDLLQRVSLAAATAATV